MPTQDEAVAKKERVKQALMDWGYETFTLEDPDDLDAEEELIRELKRIMEDYDDPELPAAASEGTVGLPTAKRARLSDETNPIEEKEAVKLNPPQKTLKDLALLIVRNSDETDLESLRVITQTHKGGYVGLTFPFTREDLLAKIAECDNGVFDLVSFSGRAWDASDDLGEAYFGLEARFSPLADLQLVLRELLRKKQGTDFDDDTMKWERDFVVPRFPPARVHFSADVTKCAAVVIAGESGSGKSWFAKNWLPNEHPDAYFIYHELDDGDAKFDTHAEDPPDEALAFACHRAMIKLKGYCDTPLYGFISAVLEENNILRNQLARRKVEEMILKALSGNATTRKWWEDSKERKAVHTLEKLIIIVDEVGKSPELARGIVDDVRNICNSILDRGLAKKAILVLVGSGLDGHIGEDSLDYDGSNLNFGTDPSKSDVIVLEGPNLAGRKDISGILVEDIENGTYSRVLATNTRMLTRGIIPVLKCNMNTLLVRPNNLSGRRVELGSTNVVMDYAARVYISLNGLSRSFNKDPKRFNSMLLQQFRLLVNGEINRVRFEEKRQTKLKHNPAFDCSFRVLRREYHNVLKLGLITADVLKTSQALRYLACEGQAAPLDAQDGVGFEIVLQHHLVRLCMAENDARREKHDDARGVKDDEHCSEYFSSRYALAQAWPPSSTTKEGLDTEEAVLNEVNDRYGNERTKARHQPDAYEIAKLLENKDDYDLVLRQSVSNAQGADVMVLSRRGTEEATVDLYQAKHYSKLPSRGSKHTIDAFASLGVLYDPKSGSFDTKPKTGSAGYSFLGTQVFVNELSDALKIGVKVRKRVVVFSKEWSSFLSTTSWNDFDFEAAAFCKNTETGTGGSNVWIWTREMLEPTISALATKPALEISDDASDASSSPA